ncbi:MAG: sensor histidine kinase [Bacteroidetes bacterium]|nr:sensor histidine kinase [Bacteroidota bacterium]
MKRILTLVLLVVVPRLVWSQQELIESYRQELKKEKIDTSRIHIIGDLSRMLIMNSDTTEALALLKEGLELCKKQNYDYGYGHIYNGYGIYYLETSQFEEAEVYFQKSYDYFKKSKKDTAPLGAATALSNLGVIAETKRDIEKAVRLKLQALDVWKATSFPERFNAVGNIYVSIGGLYSKERQFDKAIFYTKKGIETRLNAKMKDVDLGISYIFLLNDFIRNKQLDSAANYIETVESLVNELKSPLLYMRYYGSLGELEYERKNFEKALQYNKQLLSYAQQTQKIGYEISGFLAIAKCYQQLNQATNAITFFRQALSLSQKVNRIEGRKNALQGLADAYHQLNNDKSAFAYLTEFNALKDSLQAEETKLKLNDIDTKYQTVQKENQILQLEKEKSRQNALIYGLLAGLVAVAGIGGLTYRNVANQRRIAQQETLLKQKEIVQLQQERQLVATNSILKGQEEERTRVARDLHDGLGGILTSVKLTLGKVRGNFILPEASTVVFARALEQLDLAINEMRRVAHSMMPEALVRYGLPDSLKDFCEDLNDTGQIKVHLQVLGMEQRLDSSVEVVLYRIVQELLNNILKHAQATDAYVQLVRRDEIVHLTVEDNGKGFDPKQAEHHKGAGMRNIENRVAYLGGTLDIQSAVGEGTSVEIEIKL